MPLVDGLPPGDAVAPPPPPPPEPPQADRPSATTAVVATAILEIFTCPSPG
jgi:hypothetical protein